jgi:AcrR family transcriptional regulator
MRALTFCAYGVNINAFGGCEVPLALKRRIARKHLRSGRQESLRERIRSTARELFAREGYESISMRRVGAEVGCSPMAIYRHFENKEELLLSICEETFAKMGRLLDEARRKPGTPLEQLRRCVRAVMEFHLSHPNHYKVTFMTMLPPGPVAERKVAIGQPVMDRLRSGVRECAEAKGLKIDVEMAAQVIRVSIHGLAGQLITTGRCYPWKDPERLKDEVIAAVTRQLE